VLIVVDALQVPARFSGVGRQVLSIGRELHRLAPAHELEVRCAEDVRPVFEAAFPPRTRFQTPIPRSRPRAVRIAYQQLVAPALDRRPMLLIALGDQGPAWGRPAALLVLNDLRRLTEPASNSRLETAYYRFVTPRAVRHASSVVTISEFSRDEIRRVLGDGIDVRVVADHPPPQVETPLRGVESGPFLLVSALRAYKGVETAIDALALLPSESRRELILVGTDEGRAEELRGHARARGVEGLVTFAGWLEDARLRKVYERCFTTINPSTYEGYGLPVAESLSYGLPTIASEIPPHREVAGEAALYFEAANAGALSEQMLRLADPLLRASMAAAALERSRALAGLGPKWADVIGEAVSLAQSA
jgi:glycosyltransferase involved in cell wall biosynthesis